MKGFGAANSEAGVRWPRRNEATGTGTRCAPDSMGIWIRPRPL